MLKKATQFVESN